MDDAGADRLAYEVALAIQRGTIGTRSAVDDALLDYLRIGCIRGPQDVPTWIQSYECRAIRREGA